MNWEIVLAAIEKQIAANPDRILEIISDLLSLADKLDPAVLADLVKALLALLPKA